MALVDQHYQASIERSKLVGQYGLDLVRALFLLNGGAILVLATFLGSEASGPGATELFMPVIQAFGVGVIAAVAASLFGYLSQQNYSYAERAASREPEGEASSAAKRYNGVGLGMQIAALIFVVASLSAFWFGLDRALKIEVPPHAERQPDRIVVSVEAPRPPEPVRRYVGCSAGEQQIALHLGGERRNICRPTAN